MMALAILGGAPSLTEPHPHNDMTTFSEEDKRAIIGYLQGPNATTSYDGRAGILWQFEEELADFHGRTYCILTNSGTSALHSAYFGLGLRSGDEVIAPTYTYPTTVTAMFGVGAVPILADSEPDTGNLDPTDVASKVTSRTRAIVVTHQWGHPAEMDQILRIAEDHHLSVIEDASLALGARYKGRRAGSLGHVACFSLGSSKIVAGGHGGALLTDDPAVVERATLLGHPGGRSQEDVQSAALRPLADTGFGHNYRMHVLAIAMARERFRNLEQLIRKRHRRLGLLSHLLLGQDLLTPPITRPYVERGQWGGYTATYNPKRARGVPIEVFARALEAEGLEVSPRSYHPLLHRTPFFQSSSDARRGVSEPLVNGRVYRPGDLPNAEQHADSQIGFPTFLHEPEGLVAEYAEAVHKVVQNIDELADAASKGRFA